MADKQRAAVAVEVGLVERERLADPQPCAPQPNNHTAQPDAVGTITSSAHHRDDLLHGGRIRRIPEPLCCAAKHLGGSWTWSPDGGRGRARSSNDTAPSHPPLDDGLHPTSSSSPLTRPPASHARAARSTQRFRATSGRSTRPPETSPNQSETPTPLPSVRSSRWPPCARHEVAGGVDSVVSSAKPSPPKRTPRWSYGVSCRWVTARSVPAGMAQRSEWLLVLGRHLGDVYALADVRRVHRPLHELRGGLRSIRSAARHQPKAEDADRPWPRSSRGERSSPTASFAPPTASWTTTSSSSREPNPNRTRNTLPGAQVALVVNTPPSPRRWPASATGGHFQAMSYTAFRLRSQRRERPAGTPGEGGDRRR